MDRGSFFLFFKKIVLALACFIPMALLAAQPERGSGNIREEIIPPQTAPSPEAGDASGVAAEEGEASGLTPEILYQFLLGEVAGARGRLDISARVFLKLARETGDARIAKRAAEFSLFGNDLENASQAVQLWLASDPESEEALRLMMSLSAENGRDMEAIQGYLTQVLAQAPANLPGNLLGINAAFAAVPDKKAVRDAILQLTEPYLSYPEAYLARAQAFAIADELMESLSQTTDALKLRPDWEPALLLKFQLMVETGAKQQAVDELSGLLRRFPQNRAFGLAYARTLVSMQQYEQARDAFSRLLEQDPQDAEALFSAALLSYQIEDDDKAEKLFKQTLAANHPATDVVNLYLGQIGERRKNWNEAIRYYQEIGPGPQYAEAQVRIAMALNESGRPAEALAHLRALKGDEEDRLRYLLAEAFLLRESGEIKKAFDMLEAALKDYPDDESLLYDSAMLAEKLDRIDVLEARLRKLIEVAPEHAHAYNALGYTFADRNIRLDEAETLVRKALELRPDDPFILDSLGWVLFRRGNSTEAVQTLGRAYEQRADPEIAAHLGEVLWTLGLRDEAGELFDNALKDHPNSEVLRETVQRLRGR